MKKESGEREWRQRVKKKVKSTNTNLSQFRFSMNTVYRSTFIN